MKCGRVLTPMGTAKLLTLLFALLLTCGLASPRAQVQPQSASDRAALRAWFVLLAEAQFYRTTSDVTDCAALVRHALREALRPHTAEWMRLARLPLALMAPAPDVQWSGRGEALGLFLVRAEPPVYAEFADAQTIVGLNAESLGRDPAAARPGDLLYFRQPGTGLRDHLMVFVGTSPLTPDASDWVVYHTGPNAPDTGASGEVRKVRLAHLANHPSPRWRPTAGNASFAGVFRLRLLS